jgi:hypothetical protein
MPQIDGRLHRLNEPRRRRACSRRWKDLDREDAGAGRAAHHRNQPRRGEAERTRRRRAVVLGDDDESVRRAEAERDVGSRHSRYKRSVRSIQVADCRRFGRPRHEIESWRNEPRRRHVLDDRSIARVDHRDDHACADLAGGVQGRHVGVRGVEKIVGRHRTRRSRRVEGDHPVGFRHRLHGSTFGIDDYRQRDDFVASDVVRADQSFDLRDRGLGDVRSKAADVLESVRDAPARLRDRCDEPVVGLRRANKHAAPSLRRDTHDHPQENHDQPETLHVHLLGEVISPGPAPAGPSVTGCPTEGAKLRIAGATQAQDGRAGEARAGSSWLAWATMQEAPARSRTPAVVRQEFALTPAACIHSPRCPSNPGRYTSYHRCHPRFSGEFNASSGE